MTCSPASSSTPKNPFNGPDATGRFGPYGGRFVPETVIPALEELEAAYHEITAQEDFQAQLRALQRDFIGRPTPIHEARRLSARLGGARIFLKREDLCHTGAHKINNTVGQTLLATRMGKKRIIAETGAGQHGVATAAAAALFGLECTVYMGDLDIRRQALNVVRMELLGARVRPVHSGSQSLKDACNEAIRAWVTEVEESHYIIGSVVGPHPYPLMVRDFQSIIGQEARAQMIEALGRVPDALIACVGGGSNAMGLFHPFLDDPSEMIGVEAAGEGIETGRHAASLGAGRPGVLHGSYSYLLQTGDGQIVEAHSISAGLDYPGVGPEHGLLKDLGRVGYTSITDAEALEAFGLVSRTEGILPALESAHALAQAVKLAPTMDREKAILVCLSGRGDKDVDRITALLEENK